MFEKSNFQKLIELAMDCQTRQTRKIYNRLIKAPGTLVTIIFIVQLREDYNNFMTDCNSLLEAEKQIRQTQLN